MASTGSTLGLSPRQSRETNTISRRRPEPAQASNSGRPATAATPLHRELSEPRVSRTAGKWAGIGFEVMRIKVASNGNQTLNGRLLQAPLYRLYKFT
jgi:hypothetical protein